MRCGGGGNQGNKHTDNWADLCDRLIGSLQETLSTLYNGLEARMFLFQNSGFAIFFIIFHFIKLLFFLDQC